MQRKEEKDRIQRLKEEQEKQLQNEHWINPEFDTKETKKRF